MSVARVWCSSRLSRSGPICPVDPAAASVWQLPQPMRAKIARPESCPACEELARGASSLAVDAHAEGDDRKRQRGRRQTRDERVLHPSAGLACPRRRSAAVRSAAISPAPRAIPSAPARVTPSPESGGAATPACSPAGSDPHRAQFVHLREVVVHRVGPAARRGEHHTRSVDARPLRGRRHEGLLRPAVGAPDQHPRLDALERRAAVLEHGEIDHPFLAGLRPVGQGAEADGGPTAAEAGGRRYQGNRKRHRGDQRESVHVSSTRLTEPRFRHGGPGGAAGS